MRVVGIVEFLSLPGEVLYSYLGEEMPDGGIGSVIGEAPLSVRYQPNLQSFDWVYAELFGVENNYQGHAPEQFNDLDNGKEAKNSPRETRRWGMYENKGFFLVFDASEVRGIIEVLEESLSAKTVSPLSVISAMGDSLTLSEKTDLLRRVGEVGLVALAYKREEKEIDLPGLEAILFSTAEELIPICRKFVEKVLEPNVHPSGGTSLTCRLFRKDERIYQECLAKYEYPKSLINLIECVISLGESSRSLSEICKRSSYASQIMEKE